MVQNKQLSKSIYGASWNELLRQLEYKTKWKGKKFYQIETSYPSSQICNHCGYRNKELKNLAIRKWICKECKIELERDVNASINIMFKDIEKYMKELEV